MVEEDLNKESDLENFDPRTLTERNPYNEEKITEIANDLRKVQIKLYIFNL